jgi:hypothetical protein
VTSNDNCSDNQLEEPEKSAEDQWDNTEDMIASGMASASAGFASGVNPKHLSTIWRNMNGVTHMRSVNLSLSQSEVELKKRKMFDELIERRHWTSINPPKPMKGEPDTNEPDDADGDQGADVTSKRRRQRNVPKSIEGPWDIQ